MFPLEQVTIVGVGLLGGSLGLAVRARKLADRVVGVGRDAELLEEAIEAGVLTEATCSLEEGVADADLVVVCTPVGLIADHIARAAKGVRKPHAMLTDVGSTKAQIIRELETILPPEACFLGSHPFAGWHRTGFKSANAGLFEGQLVVLTPTPRTAIGVTEFFREFWTRLGSNVLEMAPAEHDLAAAMVSHLPHVLGSSLAAATPAAWLRLVAGSWRDATRVAASSESLWVDILMSNRTPVLEAIERLEALLADWKGALHQGNAHRIQQLWHQGKEHRNVVGD